MKRGRNIFKRVVAAECQVTAMRALGNGSLRALIRHLGDSEISGTEAGEAILALAMCEATARFMKAKQEARPRIL